MQGKYLYEYINNDITLYGGSYNDLTLSVVTLMSIKSDMPIYRIHICILLVEYDTTKIKQKSK